MSHRPRLTGTAIVATAAFAALLSSPPDAAADGLPVVGINARPLFAPGSDVAYVTRRSGRRTVLEPIDADSERRLHRVLLPGTLSVPAVAYDATARAGAGRTPSTTAASIRSCTRSTRSAAVPSASTSSSGVAGSGARGWSSAEEAHSRW